MGLLVELLWSGWVALQWPEQSWASTLPKRAGTPQWRSSETQQLMQEKPLQVLRRMLARQSLLLQRMQVNGSPVLQRMRGNGSLALRRMLETSSWTFSKAGGSRWLEALASSSEEAEASFV